MSAELDRLLRNLERVLDDVEQRADHGFNTFSPPAAVIAEWDAYTSCLADLCCRIETAILNGNSRPTDMTFDWGQCRRLLTRKWGINGEKAGFELARTGNEGGLRKVLQTVCSLMIEDHSKNQVAILVHAYWHRHTAPELLADADVYLEEYGHLLPSELTEGSAARIRVEFLRVLKEHPYAMRRVRQVGRDSAVPCSPVPR